MIELSEQDIRKLTEEAVRQLGSAATPSAVEQVVKEAVGRMQGVPQTGSSSQFDTSVKNGNRVIITAFGKNHPGILAGLTGILAQYNCDILDLTQKILQEFFTIMLLVDISDSSAGFEELKKAVTEKGEALDLKVIIQHEEIFKTMHRV